MLKNMGKYIIFILFFALVACKTDSILLTDVDEESFNTAVTLIDFDKAEEALEIFKELEEKYPNNDRVKWQLGWTYAALGQFQESLAYYEKAEQLNESLLEDDAFIFQYSYSLMNLEDYQIAKSYLEKLNQEELGEDQLDLYLEWMEVIGKNS